MYCDLWTIGHADMNGPFCNVICRRIVSKTGLNLNVSKIFCENAAALRLKKSTKGSDTDIYPLAMPTWSFTQKYQLTDHSYTSVSTLSLKQMYNLKTQLNTICTTIDLK